VNGLLCEARNADSLTAAIIEMMNAPGRIREAWGRAGRARVEREFDEEIVTQRYLKAIEDAFA
jgi:glycosyltransferase involved in cell wall biosynthesis